MPHRKARSILPRVCAITHPFGPPSTAWRPMRSAAGLWAVLSLLVWPGSVGAESADQAVAAAISVTPEQLRDWLAQDLPVALLDVRQPDEFRVGHIAGARNLPHEAIVPAADTLPTDRPIVVYCIHSAHRAPEAVRQLRRRGWLNAFVLDGGIIAWHAGGQRIRAADLTREPTILPVTERCNGLGATTDRVAN